MPLEHTAPHRGDFIPQRMLRDREVADLLNCSKAHVWALVKKGRLTPLRDGPKYTRFSPNAIAAYISSLEA